MKTIERANPRTTAENDVPPPVPPSPATTEDRAVARGSDRSGPTVRAPEGDLESSLRAQAAAAVSAGDLDRARRLLDAIDALQPAAPVVDIATARARRGG